MHIQISMIQLRNWFLQGIALLAPLAITVAFLFWLVRAVEVFMGNLLQGLLPSDWYIPGMGFIAGVVLTLVVGLLANLFLIRWLVGLGERIVDRIPLVKTLFQALKDMARFLSHDPDQTFGRPVAVDVQGLLMVGFVMQERARLPDDRPQDESERIAVYLPMSYQLGGYTLYFNPGQVRPLNADAEQVMRAVLTGGSLRG